MAITSNKQLKQFYNDEIQNLMERTPVCPHFGECGGCSWQHLNYATQVSVKQRALQEIMAEITTETLEVVASPVEFNYRQRMDYVCSHDPFHPPTDRLGLRKRKQFNHVIDLHECHLIDPVIFRKVRSVYNKAMELEVPIYDLVSFKGDLRYLVVRTGNGKALLSIITKTEEHADEVEQLSAFAMEQGFTTVYWLLQPTVSDVSFGDAVKFWGEQYLEMQVGFDRQITLAIGPNNFFQNNIPQFNQLLRYVADNAEASDLLLDMYCGVGTIGLALAGSFPQVVGVELDPTSVELAKRNADANDVTNIQFHAGDISNLSAQVKLGVSTSEATAIVDPPRAGLTPKGVTELLQLNPKQIVYVSCNPITLAQDLAMLREHYEIKSIRGFDMFPQTPHMETVALLYRFN